VRSIAFSVKVAYDLAFVFPWGFHLERVFAHVPEKPLPAVCIEESGVLILSPGLRVKEYSSSSSVGTRSRRSERRFLDRASNEMMNTSA